MMDLPQITIVTLNCRGIVDPDKRRRFFHFIRNLQADIICLQETHTPSRDAAFWTQQWAAPAVWTKDVAILFDHSHTFIGHNSFEHGRMLLAEVSVRGRVFSVANFYAPADRPGRKSFFERLTVDHFDPHKVAFIAGDWNCVPDPSRDRSMRPELSDHWHYLAPSLVNYFDAALQGAVQHYYTFTHSSLNLSARLDHVFVSSHLASCGFSTLVFSCPYSDHSAVHLTVTPPIFTKPLIWRLNTSLLSRSDLWACTDRAISRASASWDVRKVLALSSARDVARVAANERNAQHRRLQRQLSQAENAARASHRTVNSDPATISARSALRTHVEASATRAIFRARVRYLEQGERPSTYFFSRYRPKRLTSRLERVCGTNGQPLNLEDRHQHMRSFYSRLYAALTFDQPSCQSFLSPLALPQLDQEDIDYLSAPITAEELASVVGRLPLRRSPGPDGLPYEWYRTYLPILSPGLLALFNGILRGEDPPRSWFATTLTLLPKPDRDHTQLRNWRPITLANCDAKIFSKILANRLALVLPRLIHPDQAGFVWGQSALDIALTLKTVLSHAAEHSVDGALAFLDQEKAYDRVSHDYLLAVLQAFGFPLPLARIFQNTSGPSHTFILDEGQPLPAVPINCGVRQGDPLAPLLFNLAVEPLLASLRLRLTGVQLPWGSFKVGAFADDLTAGLAPSDPSVFLEVLDHYGRASNGLTNRDKLTIMDLFGSPATPSWIQNLGFTVHDHTQPIRVLGFDLVRTPDGVRENWSALYQRMQATADLIATHSCSLQGRVLLANTMVLSQLWYKARLSTPPASDIKNFRDLGWAVVWAGSTAFKPSLPKVGLRHTRHGGVGLLDVTSQISALQTMWIARYLNTQPPLPWAAALDFAFSGVSEGPSILATYTPSRLRYLAAPCWVSYLEAWVALKPSWNLNMAEWTPSDALCAPVPSTTSTRAPSGLRLVDLVDWDPSTQVVSLVDDDDDDTMRQFGAPGAVGKAVAALRSGTSSVPAPIYHMALSSSPTAPSASSLWALHQHIKVAGVALAAFTVASARRLFYRKARLDAPVPWNDHAVTKLGRPPADLWKRLHHPARSPRHKETFYKFLFTALPLGFRIAKLPSRPSADCHFCRPPVKQTMQHFLFSCPLAQVVWHEMRRVFALPHAVSLEQAAFSWSPQALVLGKRFGYRLQAGHAVALHVLWLAHCDAVYGNRPASIPAVRARYRALLLRHLETHWASKAPHERAQFLEDWSPPLSLHSPVSLCI